MLNPESSIQTETEKRKLKTDFRPRNIRGGLLSSSAVTPCSPMPIVFCLCLPLPPPSRPPVPADLISSDVRWKCERTKRTKNTKQGKSFQPPFYEILFYFQPGRPASIARNRRIVPWHGAGPKKHIRSPSFSGDL